MPSSDSGDNRKPFKPNNPGAPPPPEQEHLPCPRCDSTNTKFCYYNNYNLSQPRHFCKSCRRYWTHGGTLRDIPVGGGTRKNAKRSRTTTFTTITSSATSSAVSGQDPLLSTPVLVPLQGSSVQFGGGSADMKGGVNVCGSFTSLLNTQGHGFLALSGFGLGLGSGLGHGFEEMGFGIGRGVWPFPGMGDGGVNATGGGVGGVGGMGSTWQSFESVDGEFVGGDCFSLPDLAISTPGNGLK